MTDQNKRVRGQPSFYEKMPILINCHMVPEKRDSRRVIDSINQQKQKSSLFGDPLAQKITDYVYKALNRRI